MITVTTIPPQKKDVQKEKVYCLKDDETEVPKEDTLQCTSIRSFTF